MVPISDGDIDKHKIDVLLSIHQCRKTESLQHRQNIFNAFAGWTTVLLAILAVVASVDFPSALNDTLSKVIAGLVITVSTLLTALVIAFMWRQRDYSEKELSIVRNVEDALGLFEKDRYLPNKAVLTDDGSSNRRKCFGFTNSDWFQVGVIVVLTVILWVFLFFRIGC